MPCGPSRLPAGGALMADDLYTWLRALHVIAVIAWMAGMLYLPRLYVYHAAAEPGSELSETLKVMERRLLRIIINPAMVATSASAAPCWPSPASSTGPATSGSTSSSLWWRCSLPSTGCSRAGAATSPPIATATAPAFTAG